MRKTRSRPIAVPCKLSGIHICADFLAMDGTSKGIAHATPTAHTKTAATHGRMARVMLLPGHDLMTFHQRRCIDWAV